MLVTIVIETHSQAYDKVPTNLLLKSLFFVKVGILLKNWIRVIISYI